MNSSSPRSSLPSPLLLSIVARLHPPLLLPRSIVARLLPPLLLPRSIVACKPWSLG